ncbi:unnamed protein product [Leuciscus chuanchicus]
MSRDRWPARFCTEAMGMIASGPWSAFIAITRDTVQTPKTAYLKGTPVLNMPQNQRSTTALSLTFTQAEDFRANSSKSAKFGTDVAQVVAILDLAAILVSGITGSGALAKSFQYAVSCIRAKFESPNLCPSSIVLNDVLDRADSTGREELYSADDMELHLNTLHHTRIMLAVRRQNTLASLPPQHLKFCRVIFRRACSASPPDQASHGAVAVLKQPLVPLCSGRKRADGCATTSW